MSSTHEVEIIVEDEGLPAGQTKALAANEAREVTDKIRQALSFTWELVKIAYQGRAWDALGYSSWNDYCIREFGTHHIKIPMEDRQEIVGSLREAGMSIRAIGTATGLGRGTIDREIQKSKHAGVPNGTPADEPNVTAENKAESTISEESPASKIQGIDGKFYDREVPKPATPTSASSFDEDQAPEDGGIFPLDATEVLNRNAKARAQNIQRLTGSNGKYSQAPLPMVIQLAGQIAYTSAGADDLDLEEATSLADNGSRAVLVLTQLLKTVDTTVIVDAGTIEKIRANLNDAQETIDEVLTILEEG
ncbi:hypothetical protein [Glutamicibacter uratoxydans]|uniref:hypothetical protein n=1 Tax=Glutamicibacter uratoxydans TaxID=43667 RepID=UPI003D6E04C8